MLTWRIRFAAIGLIAFCLASSMGCGTSAPSFFITPSAVLLSPGQTFKFNVGRIEGAAGGKSEPVLLVNGVVGGSPSSGTITPAGSYTAPTTASGQPIEISVQGQPTSATVTIFDPASFTTGSIAATQNPLVASYSMTVPAATPVQVQFGLDTSYGLSTSGVSNQTGGEVTILVAGMRAGTTYHMQAVASLFNGSQLLGSDQTFTTGTIPADRIPNITAQTFGGGTPSPGVELFSLFPDEAGNLLSAVATDLEGNVIWYYDLESDSVAFSIKPLPNGHMLLDAYPIGAAGIQTTGVDEIREIDLAGNVIQRVSTTSVNNALPAIAKFQIGSFHHDVAALPNGHLILLANYAKTINNVPGIPDGTLVVGDALIDWDPQRGPAWAWSAFDHLSLLHAPYGVADWTHANAVVYSPDDGNLILSMRNQNWVVKIDYRDGAGDGNILWRLGPDGDFILPEQQAPIEWNYGQHYPTIVSPNSSGVFSLMLFNNGNNRLMDNNNDVCGTPGVGACYSSVPIFQLDESSKTATVLWEENLLPAYSVCCGDALVLPSGKFEFDVAFDVNTPNVSYIEEVTPTQDLVWKMDIQDQLAYRGFRIPSLYPDQVWTASAMAAPRRVASHPAHRRGAAEGSRWVLGQLP